MRDTYRNLPYRGTKLLFGVTMDANKRFSLYTTGLIFVTVALGMMLDFCVMWVYYVLYTNRTAMA